MLQALFQTLGRAHLLILHFPIALLLVALLIEAFRLLIPRKLPGGVTPDSPQGLELRRLLSQTPTPSAYACLFFATIFGVVAAGTGWLYAANEFTGGGDLDWHRWLGTIAAGLAALTLALGMVATLARIPATTNLYRTSLVLAAAAVGWAGHLGGELVHGEGYIIQPLTSRTPAPQPAPQTTPDTTPEPADTSPDASSDSDTEDPAALTNDSPQPAITPVSFQTDVAPIFESNCYRCHNVNRARGQVYLDSLDGVMLAIVPGNADASDLARVIRLPESDDASMPKNKPNLPDDQIQTIVDWINTLPADSTPDTPPDQNATSPDDYEPVEVTTAPAPNIGTPPESRAYAAADQPVTLTRDQRDARDAAIQRLRDNLVSASVRTPELATVEVRVFENPSAFTDDSLELLTGLEPCLTILDLSGTAVTDDGIAHLSANFPRLRILRLGRTAITDDAMPHLAQLPELALLDVHQTPLTTRGLTAAAASDSLILLRCWNTNTTPQDLTTLATTHPTLTLQTN